MSAEWLYVIWILFHCQFATASMAPWILPLILFTLYAEGLFADTLGDEANEDGFESL